MWQGFQYQYPHQTEKNRLANAANQPCCICTLLFGVADFGLSRLEESHNFSSPTTSTSGVVSSPGESTQPGLGPWKIWGSHMRLKWRNFRNSVQLLFRVLECWKMPLAAPTIPWAWWRPGRKRSFLLFLLLLVSKSLVKKCLALGQRLRIWPQMQDTGQSAPSIISIAFFFGGTVQSKVPGSWVWSAPSRAFAQQWSWFNVDDLEILGPMIYYSPLFSKLLPLGILHAFKHKETPTNWSCVLCFFWTQGPHVTFGPFPSLHSPMHVGKGCGKQPASAISNLPSSEEVIPRLLSPQRLSSPVRPS